MNLSLAVFLLNDAARCVGVTYEGTENEAVTLFKTMDQSIKADDFVVVPTNTRHKMTVCKVKTVDIPVDYDSTKPMDWIIGRINLADIDALKAQEALAFERIRDAEQNKRRNELRDALLASAGNSLSGLPLLTVAPSATESQG